MLEKLGVTAQSGEDPDCAYLEGLSRFLGFKIQRGKNRFKLSRDRIKSRLNRQNLYAIPTHEIVGPVPRIRIRALTKRGRCPLRLGELIQINQPGDPRMGQLLLPLPRQEARFHQLGWLDHPKALVAPCKGGWRNAGWRTHPNPKAASGGVRVG